MPFVRTPLLLVILLALLAGIGAPQNKKLDPDAGYIPTVALEDKKKKKKRAEITQALTLAPELPTAVTADTDRLAFQVTPLSGKGLLSQQIREALKTLLHSSRGPIVKLRAFVAGSGDLRRVGEIAGEMFLEKKFPLPALTVVQVGALPMEGAQVVIEATEVDRKVVNPYGVAFVAAQPASIVAESLRQLEKELTAAGMRPSDALLVTCFVSSLDDQRETRQAIATTFPSAALDYVQMQRAPVTPAVSCEAEARMRSGEFTSDSHVALVSSPQVVITGTQLAFSTQDSDFQLALDRLEKTLATKNAGLPQVVMAHLYVTSSGLSSRILALHSARSPSSYTLVPIEALPSLDASFGLDVIAVPASAHPN